MKSYFVFALIGLFFVGFTGYAQDTTDAGYHNKVKKKQIKSKIHIPQQGEGIKTLIIGGKPQLELRREDQTVKPPSYTLETVVVTSERVENKVAFTTNSSSILTSSDIQALPSDKISDVLTSLPGFMAFSKDGIGRDVITSTRGFYGGGEAEYVLVYVDGVRLNDLETGLVDWSSISADDISKMEVVRGPTSALYGDVGMGGVVNITTKEEKLATSSVSGTVGSFGNRDLDLRSSGKVNSIPYRFYVQSAASDGFRSHGGWGGTTVGGDFSVVLNQKSNLRWSLSNHATNLQDPGPLTSAQIAVNREDENKDFSMDEKNENRLNGRVDYSNQLNDDAIIQASFYSQNRDADVVRTIPFAATAPFIFFLPPDTKERVVTDHLLGLEGKGTVQDTIEDIANKFIFGGELEFGKLQSTYFGLNSSGKNFSNWLSSGEGKRTHVGFYVHDEVPIIPTIKLNAGFRFDNFNDSYDVFTRTSSYSAFSPKIGVNYLYSTIEENEVPIYTGNVYANISRAFKAPTLDQLFDQRTFSLGGVNYQLSNYKLKPQTAWNFELGLYQRGRILEKKLYGELQTSFYYNTVKDEIDYDPVAIQYGNITQTKHTGVEAGFRLHWIPNITAFLNYTYTSAVFDGGPTSGKQLMGIPKNNVSFGITYRHRSNLSGSITWNYVSSRFLDNANTSSAVLEGNNVFSVRIAYKHRNYRAYIDLENIAGTLFNDFGYQLPADGAKVYYPHAPSTLRLGVEATLNTPWISK